jgi:hypothetical protein
MPMLWLPVVPVVATEPAATGRALLAAIISLRLYPYLYLCKKNYKILLSRKEISYKKNHINTILMYIGNSSTRY